MSAKFLVGDVFERLREMPNDSVDLVVTSPPFLALRSYLPADHPDKNREIGGEPTPAAFVDAMLAVVAECSRVLAPHGSLCMELGDTFAGSGGAGGDYLDGGRRAGQNGFVGSARRDRSPVPRQWSGGSGWPRAKSMALIPHAVAMSLAYGRNILSGADSPAGEWLIRNMICWARPNPAPGALGDKFRPATSFIIVATRNPKRFFDLGAVRLPGSPNTHARTAAGVDARPSSGKAADDDRRGGNWSTLATLHSTDGAPPLDWHADVPDREIGGDMLWRLPTRPYRGSHYAVYPLELPRRLVEAMCPRRVCTECGGPSRRIVERTPEYAAYREQQAQHVTTGWTDCGHDAWRNGVVLDPFAGSGTTLAAASGLGRDAVGIDIDERNVELARERVGPLLFDEVPA